MPLLEISGVSKSFPPGVLAVDEASLSLEAGELLCLLGPSGCGKTTLLRIVAGLETADAGGVRFDGRDMAAVPPHERDFGMMFQDFALFPHRNVFDNVAFGLRMRRLPAGQISQRVDAMLKLVDLEGFETREIGQLSGGEQQRVALARALAPGPRLLMLDEPLGALDRVLRERLMVDVRAILKHIGMTAIYVTHDQTEALAVSDRVAVMNAGRIEQVDAPRVVYERPFSPFVARFLGFENLLPGQRGVADVIETPVGPLRPERLPITGVEVVVLLRPEAATLKSYTHDDTLSVNQFAGVVETVAFRGRYAQIWLAVNGQRLLFEEPGQTSLKEGDAVHVTVSPDLLSVYEPNLRGSRTAVSESVY